MKTFLITFSLIVLTLTALGTTVSTPASVATRGLRTVITKYLANGGDINVLTMENVIKMVNINAANSTAQGKFEDRFEILGGGGPVDQATMAKMIAYTANRIHEDRRDAPGRYVIWLADGEVNYNWESEEKVTALLDNVGMKLVDRGPWNQPDTKAQSMFHVGVGPKQPLDDRRVQEDLIGRRLRTLNSESQDNQKQSTEQHPNNTSAPRTLPDAQSLPISKGSGANHVTLGEGTTPWHIIVVLIVAAMGLLWLMLQRRK